MFPRRWTVGAPDDSVLQVKEEFAYEVSYGRIRSMLFDVPEQILEVYAPGTGGISIPGSGLRFYDETGKLLESTADDDRISVVLPDDRHGSFVISLEYALSLPGSNPGSREEYLLPMVQPLDADVTRTSVHADPTNSLDAVALDSSWQSLPHFFGGSVFYIDEGPEECRLELLFSSREFAQRLKITAGYLQTAVDQAGTVKTSGVYVLEHPPAELLISLPAGHSEAKFLWNGELVSATRSEGQDSDIGPYVLTLYEAASNADSGRLVVDFQVDATSPLGTLSQLSVEFPSFGPDVRIEETIWDLVLPHKHLLSESPKMMTPEFSWQRQTLLWMRNPTDYVGDRRSEIVGDAFEMPSLRQAGSRYAFSATGSVSHVQVGVMHQPFVVLLGAGLALLLGFVFRRVPAIRSVYALIVLAFVFALAAVWYLELMQLLIQPALIGVCLALLAVKFDTTTRTGAGSRADEFSSESVTPESAEKLSSVQSSVASGVARTALFRAANSSDSGSRANE